MFIREENLVITIWHDVPVEYAKENWRQASKEYVVQLDVEIIVKVQRTEATEVCEVKLWHRNHTVFVEEAVDKLWHWQVLATTMH